MRTGWDLSPVLQRLHDQLAESRCDVIRIDKELAKARARRNQLILKAKAAGFSTHEIAKVAGCSAVHVGRIK